MITIYLAGKMSGITLNEAQQWRDDIIRKFRSAENYVFFFDPTDGLELYIKDGDEKLTVLGPHLPQHLYGPMECFHRDLYMVDESDIVLANLNGDHWQSLGTIFEIGYAYAKGKRVIVIAGPDDYAAKHPFITSHATIVKDIHEAEELIEKYLPQLANTRAKSG